MNLAEKISKGSTANGRQWTRMEGKASKSRWRRYSRSFAFIRGLKRAGTNISTRGHSPFAMNFFVESFLPIAPILGLHMPDSWKSLLRIATEVVSETIASLPPDLQAHAHALSVVYEPVPSEALLEEGWEPDILGLYSGDPISVSPAHSSPTPREIRLFLENLWDFSEGDEEAYREEVHVTYLHELGHYLGLDEEELEDRDLL